MNLFSKLFGEKAGKDVANALEELMKAAADGKKKSGDEPKKPEEPAKPEQTAAPEPEEYDGPSGNSWGPRMPDEPNQYNYKGTYLEYFREIFNTEFPGYTVDEEVSKYGKTRVFKFKKDGRTALVVELLSQKCEAKALRAQCRRDNIPYLRYYFDYEGWWNTRSYVIERTQKALLG